MGRRIRGNRRVLLVFLDLAWAIGNGTAVKRPFTDVE
jgi:hypothetical protein